MAGVRQVRGRPKDEERLFADAARALVVLRARSGDPMPDVHLGHILGVDGWDKKTPSVFAQLEAEPDERSRWMAAILSIDE